MIGTLLQNRYRIDAQLGQGGMGVVYRSHDTLLSRDVAIKVLQKASNASIGTQGRARLLHEAKAAAQLNHPNIVSIFDAGEALITGQEGKIPFIVMELLGGESLFDCKPQSIEQILPIARQVCAALEHAHNHGVIHRDLKPENIFLEQDGSVKLTDFGLAHSIISRMTVEGMIVGTALYLSPEAALGQKVDARSDLYSFGVILYEMVTGSLPFTAEDPLAVISQHLYAPVVPPRARKHEIPSALNDLILQLLCKQPEDRPASAAEVRQVLEAMEHMIHLDAALLSPEQEPSVLERLVRGRLVGRERELNELNTAWQRALIGDGYTILVSGEPGIGKTRLVRELITRAAVSGGRTLIGSCYAEGGIPYTPFPQIIQETFSSFTQAVDLPAFVLQDLIKIVPELSARYPQLRLDASLESQAEQQRIFESLLAWVSQLASQSPVLLFVDDIHWADRDTLFLLRHLARRARKMRLLIVLTYREIEIGESSPLLGVLSDLNRERLATRIKLVRLDREQTRLMLAAILSPMGELDPTLVDAIFRETEGNPFFIEEVTKALIEEGKLCYKDVCWVATEAGEIEIPQSVRLTVLSRLSRLPSETQDVLRMAAILGREFDFETLRNALEIGEDALIEALENAERAQIINELPHRKTTKLSFSFVHALIPSTLRDSISGLRRQRLHQRAAAAIEAVYPSECPLEALAYHYEQAGDPSRARTYYLQAGDQALEVFANQEAERYDRSALLLGPTGSEQANLLSRLGEALFRQGLYEQAVETWQQAAHLYQSLQDGDQTARLYARLARAAWYTGDTPGGLKICREGLRVILGGKPSSEAPETPGMAALIHETARALRFNGLPEEALPLCHQALSMSQRLGLVEIQAETLATLGILPNQDLQAAQQALVQAVQLAESAGLLAVAARAHLNLCGHFQRVGDFSEARQHALQASALAHRLGNTDWEFKFYDTAVENSLALGDFESIEQDLQTLRKLSGEGPNREDQVLRLRMLEAQLSFYRGDWGQAESQMQACVEEARRQSDSHTLHEVNIPLAQVLIETGRFEEAELALTEAIQKDEQRYADLDLNLVAAHSLLCISLIGQGRVEEARHSFHQASEFYTIWSIRLQGVILDMAEALLAAAERRWEESLKLAARGSKLAAELGARWFQAILLREGADIYIARGGQEDQKQALGLLREAQRIFEQIHAPGYIAQIQEKLRIFSDFSQG